MPQQQQRASVCHNFSWGSVEQGNLTSSLIGETPSPKLTSKMIAGQPVNVFRKILEKMLIASSQSEADEKEVRWNQDEMAALTEIFKHLVNSELSENS